MKKEITQDKNIKKKTKKQNENTIYNSSKEFLLNLKKSFNSLFRKETRKEYISEYYELPQSYNESTVRLIAQTPKRLFVYWDISTRQKEALLEAYGDTFFEDSYPILIVKSKSNDIQFEVTVNDFANSWYIDIPDDTQSYKVEYGRRLKKGFNNLVTQDQKKQAPKNIYTTNIFWNNIIDKKNLNENISFPASIHTGDTLILKSSNELISPNGHINDTTSMKFIDIKTGSINNINSNDIKANINHIYDELNNIKKELNNEYIGS